MRTLTTSLLVLMICAVVSAAIPVQDPPASDPIGDGIKAIDVKVQKYKRKLARATEDFDDATEDGDVGGILRAGALVTAYLEVISDLEALENTLKGL